MLYCYDLETHLMGPNSVIPEPVSAAVGYGSDELLCSFLCEPGEFEALAAAAANPEEGDVVVAANASFDMSVICRAYPHMIPDVFRSYKEGRIQCVIVREKLLALADTGDLEYAELPGGTPMKLGYSLSEMEKMYLGVDRSDDKSDPDSWRLRYRELATIPVDKWPLKAIEYAVDDIRSLPLIYEAQEDRRKRMIERKGVDPWGAHGDNRVLYHRCLLDFVLAQVTAQGMRVDAEEARKVQKEIEESLTPESMSLLLEKGIVIPAKGPEPYANGAKDKDGNLKMKKAQPEKTSRVKLQAHIAEIAERNPMIEVKYSKKKLKKLEESGNEDPTTAILCDAAWLTDNADYDEVLQQWQHRQSYQKLLTTDIPRMQWNGEFAARVYPEFDVLKETGRTSSYASKLYPSLNGQNPHKKIRRCFIADPGHALVSTDYEGMELGTLAQVCLRLYGYSRHADLINQGVNIHTYLGAQLARHLDPEFKEVCKEMGLKDPMAVYREFEALDECGDPELEAFFDRFRTFAKPTDLGYPGGLRERTFIQYAKATYGVDLVEIAGGPDEAFQLAKDLREIWLGTFPEMEPYFSDLSTDKWRDFSRGGKKTIKDKETGEPREIDVYCYTTPMGMHRAQCRYNAAANGMVLQSPSAEGATLALARVVEASTNPELESPIFGVVKVCDFIHDELLYQVPLDDKEVASRAVEEVERIMVQSMMEITPDVQSRVKSAMMLRWDKGAKGVRDEQGYLIPCDLEKEITE